MALTVSTLIDDALAEAYPHIAEYAVGKGHLVRHLSSLEHDIVQTIAIHGAHRLSTAGTEITIVAATNATGYTLTDALKYVSFHYVDKNGAVWPRPIRIVRDDQFDYPPDHPAGIVRVSSFFPCDPQAQRWAGDPNGRSFFSGDGDKVLYRYVPRPTALTSLSQTLVSPDECRTFLVKSLVYQLLLAYPGTSPNRLNEAQAARTTEWESLHILLAKRSPVQSAYAGDPNAAHGGQ